MNQLLYNRSVGTLGPQAFARIQTTQLIRAIQPCPQFRFDGGEKEIVPWGEDEDENFQSGEDKKIWAHQAGANALAIDVDGKL